MLDRSAEHWPASAVKLHPQMLPASTPGGGLLSGDQTWGRLLVKLPLRHPSKAKKNAGEIELEVTYRPSRREGQPRMLGPVRFRQHLSPNAGLLTGGWWILWVSYSRRSAPAMVSRML